MNYKTFYYNNQMEWTDKHQWELLLASKHNTTAATKAKKEVSLGLF